MNHDEYRQGRVPHGNGALSRLWGPNVAGRGGRCQSPIGGDEGAPELIGERDVQAVQHADTLAKGVGAPQVSNGREGRVVAAARSPRRARRGRMPGSISPARTSRDSAESISAGWCAGELTSSPAICLRTHPAAGCRAPRQRARRRPARSPAELLSHGGQGAGPCRWRRRDAVGGTGPALPIPAGPSSAVRVRRLPERARTAATAASWLPGTAHPGGRRSPWAYPHGIPMPIHASLLSWR